jgi:hypothetical protein
MRVLKMSLTAFQIFTQVQLQAQPSATTAAVVPKAATASLLTAF